MSPICCVEQKVVVGGQKKLHVFLSEAIGCFFPFFGQCGSREREPCNVPSPYPPWHITYVMCRTILFPGTSHVQCANTLRSEAHDICYVPSLVPPWHITWSALARGSVTPNGAPVVVGGVRQHNVTLHYITLHLPLSVLRANLFRDYSGAKVKINSGKPLLLTN